MQAELIAAATCADECKWFHNIFASSKEIFGPLASIPLLVDNQAALSTANHPLTTPWKQHPNGFSWPPPRGPEWRELCFQHAVP